MLRKVFGICLCFTFTSPLLAENLLFPFLGYENRLTMDHESNMLFDTRHVQTG